ncbi:glycosyltransferase involved in cell wall biosynthesis [Mycoplana sp. BE70]|uniref:glycosyltransferase n=1 Tax=Mycoplana sp. BE70 TaxID=2817775 RepID=UPI00285686DF|nr:glycosyltransferase [Mycoplana sp. BE70]MDR6756410.1 glycosyltransferase involved in cell wall biosynthesis [Mycoplana sp. BE70]
MLKSSQMPPEYRSALADYPAPPVPEQPTVGIVIPICNEIAHLKTLASDVFSQDYPSIAEIWFADAGSTDGTLEMLQDMQRIDPRVRVIENSHGSPAAALNLALPRIRTDIVLRLDAHARYQPDVVRQSVSTLLATGAGGVGAIARPLPAQSIVGRAIVAAHRSPFGIGVAKFRREGAVGWADTVWNGCYWKYIVDQVGPLREDLWRAEDNDFNERIRRLGYGLYLSPEIRAFYQPRQSLPALCKQYFGNGLGGTLALVENWRALRLRHLAPLALVASLSISLAVSLFWPAALVATSGILLVYSIALLSATLLAACTSPGMHLLFFPVVLVSLHLSYGCGSLYGLALRSRSLVTRLSGSIARSISTRRRPGPWRWPHPGLTLWLVPGIFYFLLPSGTARTEPAIWLVPSLERIERDAVPGDRLAIELYAARGETESFQLGINAPDTGLTNVTIQLQDLVNGDRAHIAATNVTRYREHYVHVTRSSPDLHGSNRPLGPGWYADALIPLGAEATAPAGDGHSPPATAFSVPSRQNQPIWIDVFVPRDTLPGRYSGAVTVSSDQGNAVGEVVLHVWNFTLPLIPSLNSAFLIWKANTPQAQAELLKHRLMPRDVRVQDQASFIDRFGLKSVNLGLWSNASMAQCTMTPPPSLEEVQEAAAEHNPELRLFNYTADEIDRCGGIYETMKAWARVLHEAGVDNLVTMKPAPELYDDGTGSGRSAVDIWVLLPTMYESSSERVAEVLAKGDEVWSYNALVQDEYSPKWEIDFAPINYRIQPGFINQSLGLTGLLYWRVDLWTDNPWKNVQTYRTGGNEYPGEGLLLYPGQPVGVEGVVPSMRLKWLRDGVEDYEFVEILKRKGCGEVGGEIARTIGASWRHWTQDPEFLESQRRRLGNILSGLRPGDDCHARSAVSDQ